MIAIVPQPAIQAAAADHEAFEAIVNAHGRRLYGVALSILRNQAEAEDAVQETMMKAWRAWGGLRDPGRRSAWLTRICVNHCLSRRRGGWRRLFSTDAVSHEHPDPSAQRAFDPVDTDLAQACARLSLRQRAVVTLHYHYGYSLDECARMMGSRPGTVRSHLNRALVSLREDLNHG